MPPKKTPPGPKPESVQSKDAKFAGWYTRAIAAKKLGISLSTLKRRIDEGELYAEADGDGIWWLNPAEIDPLIPEAANEGSAAVIHAGAGLVKQAQDHIEVLVRHVTEPSQQALKIIMANNARLTEENRVLRERETEYLKAREAMVSEAHERELASRIVDAREKRYEEGFKLIMQVAPRLFEQAVGAKDLKPLVDVLEQLEPAMIDMLVPDFLTEEQAKKIKEVQERLRKAKPKPTVETKGEEVKEPPKPEQSDTVPLDSVLNSNEENP